MGMKKYIVLGLIAAMVVAMAPAMAANNYNMPADDFAAAMLKNTISNLDIGNKFLDVLDKANTTVSASGWYLFQNLWGVAYGGLILAGFNNQITALVLDNISTNSTDLGYIGLGLSYLGSNASTVFGDIAGSKGLARLFAAQVDALTRTTTNNTAAYYYQPGETMLQGYARALSQTIYADVLVLYDLAKAIPAAFPTFT